MPKMMTIVTKEEKNITSLVNELGCIQYDQLQYMFPDMAPDTLKYYVQSLYNSYTFGMCEGNIIVPFTRGKADHNLIDCIWIVIDNLDHIPMDLLYRAQSPSSLFYQMDDGILQELVRLTPENANIIPTLQERYLSRHAKKDDTTFQYVFVIDDDRMLDIISNYEIQVPHMIAKFTLLPDQKATVEYFRPNA